MDNPKDKLTVLKTDTELYNFLKFCAKLAGSSSYKLVKIKNALAFYTFNYAVRFEMKNEIMGDTLIDCIDGKYGICKNLNNTFTLVRADSYNGDLLTDIDVALIGATLKCSVSPNDEYKIHEVCKHVMIKDEYISMLTQYPSLDVYTTDNHIVLSNAETSQIYNVLNTTKIIIGFEFKEEEN